MVLHDLPKWKWFTLTKSATECTCFTTVACSFIKKTKQVKTSKKGGIRNGYTNANQLL